MASSENGIIDYDTFNMVMSFLNTLFAFCALVVSVIVLRFGYWRPRMSREDYLERWRLERKAFIVTIGNTKSEVEFGPTKSEVEFGPVDLGHL